MKVLILLFVVNQVYAKDEFGTSYLKDRRLCREWTCINSKLGFADSLPSRAQYTQVLRTLLPENWHGSVEAVLDGCYGNRSRRYTNSCPGQALLHCTFDQLIENCPEANSRKNDKCSPVSSFAGFKYMIAQDIYENFEANLAREQRPAWFMRHYFINKCCNLPDIFSSSILAECGFTHTMHYRRHYATQVPVMFSGASTQSSAGLQVINLPPVPEVVDDSSDPLDCCDMSSFIQPSWRTECDFKMTWNADDRLTVEQPSVTTPVPTTTTTAKPRMDVKVLPLTCAQETCVFRKLNIVSDSGAVDLDAFSKLLDNLTTGNPAWAKAKARVVTKCLTRPLVNYIEGCEINKLLACTFDVLSENCPTSKKHDPCRHSSTVPNDIVCQISSARFVPRTRHQYCELPALVNSDVLQECSMSSLSRLEYSTHPVAVPKSRKPSVYMCNKLTDSTTCLLSKMGVLNKYQFMDYFKMKDSIRSFMRTHHELQYYTDAYFSAFDTMPRYTGYCSSPKKLLNLLDAMLMTCPLSKRKSSRQCDKMFNEMSQSPLQNRTLTAQQLQQIVNQFQHIFIPSGTNHQNVLRSSEKPHKVSKKLYDFGILSDGKVPPVRIIDVNPTARPIKVLLPVYQQIHGNGVDLSIHSAHDNGVWRGGVGRG